jgi:hypothetical protein
MEPEVSQPTQMTKVKTACRKVNAFLTRLEITKGE